MSEAIVEYDTFEPVQEFHRWLRKNLISTGNTDVDSTFLPPDKLSEYLDHNLERMLSEIYKGDENGIHYKQISSGYSAVFCILLRIGQIKFLQRFLDEDTLKDIHLPLNPEQKPTKFPIDTHDSDFYEKFCAEQWRFCPPLMEPIIKNFEKDRILPFESKELIAEGGSAYVYKISVYPYYNSLAPVFSNNTLTSIFALKTYKGPAAEETYRKELKIFQRLRNSTNVIGFYSGFKHGHSYNIILEYADQGTLKDFFRKMDPPTDGRDILALWKGFLELIKGVKDLHSGKDIVWHQDIKPENILLVSSQQGQESHSPYQLKFKLADFSTGHIKSVTTTNDDDTDRDSWGTRTYGAPECYRPDGPLGQGDLRIKSSVDIWSLGCVTSEFFVWMAGGYKELCGYRRARRAAIRNIPAFQDSDCFHDGYRVLPTINEWHGRAKSLLFDKTEDTITCRVPSMIEDMLKEKDREDAHHFCNRGHEIYYEGVEVFQKTFPGVVLDDALIPGDLKRRERRAEPEIPPPNLDYSGGVTASKFPQHVVDAEVAGLASLSMTTGYHESNHHVAHSTLPDSNRSLHISNSALGQRMEPQSNSIGDSITSSSKTSHKRSETLPEYIEIQAHPSGQLQPASRSDATPVHRSHHMSTRSDPQMDPSFRNSPYQYRRPDRPYIADISGQTRNGFGLGMATSPTLSTQLPSTSLPLRIPSETPEKMFNKSTDSAIPHLSIEDAENWRTISKASSSIMSKPEPPPNFEWIFSALDGRDSVFIVDDAESMREHWHAVIRLFSIVAWLIKSRDKDGLDLYFTQTDQRFHDKHTSRLAEAIQKRMNTSNKGISDMSIRLEQILDKYAMDLRSRKEGTRGLNLYIFTDGIWTPGCDVVHGISKIVQILQDLRISEKKIGLQFISFGKDKNGLARMDLLDNHLGLPYDIVDTTPSTGNLCKIIRGAISRDFDEAND